MHANRTISRSMIIWRLVLAQGGPSGGSNSIAKGSSNSGNNGKGGEGGASWSRTHVLQYFKYFHLVPASGLRVAYDTLLDGR